MPCTTWGPSAAATETFFNWFNSERFKEEKELKKFQKSDKNICLLKETPISESL